MSLHRTPDTATEFCAQYHTADGYSCSDRPRYFKIAADRLDDLPENPTDEQIEDFYEAAVLENFQAEVGPDSARSEDFVAWVRARLAEAEE